MSDVQPIPREKIEQYRSYLPSFLGPDDPRLSVVGQPYWPQESMSSDFLDLAAYTLALVDALQEVIRSDRVPESNSESIDYTSWLDAVQEAHHLLGDDDAS